MLRATSQEKTECTPASDSTSGQNALPVSGSPTPKKELFDQSPVEGSVEKCSGSKSRSMPYATSSRGTISRQSAVVTIKSKTHSVYLVKYENVKTNCCAIVAPKAKYYTLNKKGGHFIHEVTQCMMVLLSLTCIF